MYYDVCKYKKFILQYNVFDIIKYGLVIMFYRVEALRSIPGTQEYDSDSEIVMTTRSRRHGDVCRAIYYYLLAGYWVRILDDDDQLVGGPFHPGAVLPIPFKAFARSIDPNEYNDTEDGIPFQNQQTGIRTTDGRPSHPSF